MGDASVLSEFMRRVDSWDPLLISASPPCQAYSTTDIQHLSDAPRLISLIRDHLRATGRLYVIENVKGAASDLLGSAQLLYGAFFGLGVDRPRFFETKGRSSFAMGRASGSCGAESPGRWRTIVYS